MKLQSIGYVLGLILAVAACSADETGGTGSGGGSGGGAIPTGGTPAISGSGIGSAGSSGAVATGCEARGQTIACYCSDGTLSGTQFCSDTGELAQCSGCPEVAKETPLETDTALCPKIAELAGCEPTSHFAEELPASILFVVDRSGSMVCNTPADGQSTAECEADPVTKNPALPTKWDITRDALKQVFDKLLGSNARAGLMFFSNDDYCGVNSDPLLGGVVVDRLNEAHIENLKAALDVVEPGGGTPIVGATILAYEHLHLEWGGDCGDPPCGAPGNRYVVLITDGEDSCPDPTFEGAPCGSGGIACTGDAAEFRAANPGLGRQPRLLPAVHL